MPHAGAAGDVAEAIKLPPGTDCPADNVMYFEIPQAVNVWIDDGSC